MNKLEVLLTFPNTSIPFVFKKGKKYFISNVSPRCKPETIAQFEKHSTEYKDDPQILLNAIKNVKSIEYQEMNKCGNRNEVKTKEDYWQYYFNYMYSGTGGLILWHNPTEVWRDELSRRGELLCPKCKNPMTMYYTPTCFHCEKPKKDEKGRYMFIPVCYYIALKNNLKMPAIKQALWDEFVRGNDRDCDLYFTGKKKIDDYLAMIDKEFPIAKNIFFISW